MAIARWMAPMVGLETLPYSSVYSPCVLTHIGQHGLQVADIQQRQALVIGHPEQYVQAHRLAFR